MNVNIMLSRAVLYKDISDTKLNILKFGVYKNMLRLYVSEASKDNIRDNKLLFTMPIPTINARVFSNTLEELNEKEDGFNIAYSLFGKKFMNNQPVPNEKELMGVLGLARVKHKEGGIVNIIYITTPLETKYIFPLLPTPYMEIIKNGETIKDKTELSRIWTKAYSDNFKAILDNFPEAKTIGPKSNNNSYRQSSPGAKPKPLSPDEILNEL